MSDDFTADLTIPALARSLVELTFEDVFGDPVDPPRTVYAHDEMAEHLDVVDVAWVAVQCAQIAVLTALDATNGDKNGPSRALRMLRRVLAEHAANEATADAEAAIDAEPDGG